MKNFLDRARLFFSKDKEFRTALYQIMGFYPHNIEIYRVAFAHKSQEYRSKKTGNKPLNNERLEFLGDAVLETVVSDIVYHHFKNKREGFLTNTRAKIVSRESLGQLAKDLGIDRLIQSQTHSRAHNSYIGGNSFEALMGAIYLDRGFRYAFRFVEKRIIGAVLDLEGVAQKEVNFKSKLLEWSQKNRIRLEFKESHSGNNQGNNPAFCTQIIIEGIWAGEGKGFSKKESHQNASKDALTQLRRDPEFLDRILRSKEKRTAMEAGEFFVLPKIDEIEAAIANEQKLQGERKRTDKNKKAQEPRRERQERNNERGERQERNERNERSERRQERDEKPRSEQSNSEQPKAEQPKRENKREKASQKAEANGERPHRKSAKEGERNDPKPQKSQQQETTKLPGERPEQQPSPDSPKASAAKTVAASIGVATETLATTKSSAPLSTPSTDEAPASASATPAPASVVTPSEATATATPATAPSTAETATSSAESETANDLLTTPSTEASTSQPTTPSLPAEEVDFIPIKMVDIAEQTTPEATQLPEVAAPESPTEEASSAPAQLAATTYDHPAIDTPEEASSTPDLPSEAHLVVSTTKQPSDEVDDKREQIVVHTEEVDDSDEATTEHTDDEAISTHDEAESADEAAHSDEPKPHREDNNAKRKARRKGRRTQASEFANTTLPPAEQSHRAEKAKRKQAEQQRERAKQKAREALFDAEVPLEDAPQAEANTEERPTREGRQRQGRQQRQHRPDSRRNKQPEEETADDIKAREALIAKAEAEAYGDA